MHEVTNECKAEEKIPISNLQKYQTIEENANLLYSSYATLISQNENYKSPKAV